MGARSPRNAIVLSFSIVLQGAKYKLLLEYFCAYFHHCPYSCLLPREQVSGKPYVKLANKEPSTSAHKEHIAEGFGLHYLAYIMRLGRNFRGDSDNLRASRLP